MTRRRRAVILVVEAVAAAGLLGVARHVPEVAKAPPSVFTGWPDGPGVGLGDAP